MWFSFDSRLRCKHPCDLILMANCETETINTLEILEIEDTDYY